MIKVASGRTSPQDWVDYNGGPGGIYVDVDTSSAKFVTTPHYFVALHGASTQWRACGMNSIYNESPTGFRVYLAWADNDGHSPNAPLNPLRANFASVKKWYLKWTGIETEPS